jgi:hypothetical protein
VVGSGDDESFAPVATAKMATSLANGRNSRTPSVAPCAAGDEPASVVQAGRSGKKGKRWRSSGAGGWPAAPLRGGGVGRDPRGGCPKAVVVNPDSRPVITKSLWSDAHRPPDLVRSTGGTSL